jgi:hypothetical protein
MISEVYLNEFYILKQLFLKYSILEEYHEKIIDAINEGLPDIGLTQIEIYDYFAKILFQYSCKEPDLSKIASEYQVKIYSNVISTNYLNLINKQYELGLISDNFYNFVINNSEKLLNMIVWERDNLIDYFGLKTLERSYLKYHDKKLIERPQMMWLRCAIQIHGLYNSIHIDLDQQLKLIKETYDYMSELFFTHATPTLFNSGSKFPQLSSCYLLQCPDDLEQIGDSLKAMMMISKWAGGLGINLSDIRSNGSFIKTTGGISNGIIPLCKVLESLARYVNQCFSKDTIVYSKKGPVKVENIKVDDELITIDGTFKKVLEIFKKNVNKELLKIRVNDSFESTNVTNEHQIYAIVNQEKNIDLLEIINRLKLKIIQPIFVSASDLKSGDLISYPIPNFINDIEQDLDFFRFYGIIIGNGYAIKTNNSVEFYVKLRTETKFDTYNFVINYLTNKQIHYLIDKIDEQNIVLIKWTENIYKLQILYGDIYDENN